MDNRDLKRLSTKAKQQGSHNLEGAFQQLAQDVALRQTVNDSSMNEIKEQVEEMNKICQDNQESVKSQEKMVDTNTRDIEILKDQMGILKNCIVDLQKRNQFLEDLNASLINQLKNLVDGLSVSAMEEQHVMKEVISEILLKVRNKPAGSKGRRSGRTSPCDFGGRKSKKNSTENIHKQANEAGSSQPSEVANSTENVSKDSNDSLMVDDKATEPSDSGNLQNAAITQNEPLIYQVKEKHGDSGSKALRINIAPTNDEQSPVAINSPPKSSFSSSFSNHNANLPKGNKKKKGNNSRSRTTSLQILDVMEENSSESDWPDTDKLLDEIKVIEEKNKSSQVEEEVIVSAKSSNQDFKKSKDHLNNQIQNNVVDTTEVNNGEKSITEISASTSLEKQNNVSEENLNSSQKCAKQNVKPRRRKNSKNKPDNSNHNKIETSYKKSEKLPSPKTNETSTNIQKENSHCNQNNLDTQKQKRGNDVEECGTPCHIKCDEKDTESSMSLKGNSKDTTIPCSSEKGNCKYVEKCKEVCSAAIKKEKVSEEVKKNEPEGNIPSKGKKDKKSKESTKSNSVEPETQVNRSTKNSESSSNQNSSEISKFDSKKKHTKKGKQEPGNTLKDLSQSSNKQGECSAILSPDAKEFEPTREYGKAKLQLSPEVTKESKAAPKCPKLTDSR